MTTDKENAQRLLDELTDELEREQRKAIFRAKLGIGVRAFLIVFVAGYMSWISSSVSRLSAGAVPSR